MSTQNFCFSEDRMEVFNFLAGSKNFKNPREKAGDGTRTRDILLGRQMFYQTELLPHY
jgi:hypothetical protein